MKNLLINRALAAKKKKLFTFFLALVAGTGTMFAEKVKIGDLYYDLFAYNQTARVARNSVGGDIVIPASVTYNSETYSVTSIGDSAFYNCSRLTSIEIPNSVTYIGYNAFDYCSSLTSVHISDIAAWCAIDCRRSRNPMYYAHNLYLNGELVTDLVIPNGVTSIGMEAFYGCSSLTSVTIPSSVTSIGSDAFNSCTGIGSVHIFDIAAWCAIFFSDNPLKYAHNLYLNGELVTDLVIPNSVTSIAYQAFSGCTALTSVTIPNSVTSIRDYAFYDCTSLTSVTIPNSVTSIGNKAFFDCNGLTSVTIGNSVTSIGDWAFSCSGLTSVIWNAKECSDFTDQSPFIRRITSFIFGDEVEYIPANLCSGFSNLTSIIIPNSVDSIGGSAFLGCTGLTSVTIPNSVTSIGEKAFHGCTGLTSVTIGNSVTSIGGNAFSGCRSLTSITIPNSVDSIGNYAFYSCDSLTSVTINSNKVLSKNYKGNRDDSDNLLTRFGSQVSKYVIGDSVTRIGNNAFMNYYYFNRYGSNSNSRLKSITFGNNVTCIGNAAFSGCRSLTSITIPNSVDSIGNSAFYGCTGLTSVTIPDSVTSIGGGAFRECTGLTSVTIPNSVTSIGDYAFKGCTGLTSVTIPNSVTSIGYEAFSSCTGLISVTIPNSVTNIGDYAFSGCTGLISVTIPNSVTSIGNKAFSGCRELDHIYMIAQTPPSIGSFAFPYNSLTRIYVLCNSADDYKIAWSDYANLIRADCSSYTIKFVNWDGSNLQASQVTYGDMPQYTGIQPTKPSDSQYTYTFAGWTPDIGPAVRSTTYKATFTAEPKSGLSYTITFVNWDGSNLQTLDITEGDMPQYTGATPTRPDDSQYTYTFSGWTPQIVAATADATYTATFTAELIPSSDCTDVNATWLQTGGSSLGEITTNDSTVWFYDAQYGAKATKQGGYTGYLMTPAKDLRGMKSVTLSFMHTHKFAGTPSNELTLWVTPDYNGSVEASQWQQLTIAPYAANTNWTFVSVSINVPVSKVGANTVFAFKYMSTTSNHATWEIKNLTLIAQCEGSTPPQPTYYTIKFKNWDGSVLQSTQVEEGQMPQYTGATPTKPSDSQYSYTFSGWTPQIVAATADAIYTATFTATKLPTEECGVNATWLQTGGSGLGEITTDNSGVWKYEYQYGACAKANSGETGWLLTPAKDLRGMKSVNLSFLHVHKNAGTFTDDMTLWVCANYKGSVGASQWQQLTITPYSTNNNWVYVNVSIDVPLGMVGVNTVFGFKYTSSNYSAKWEIKELNLNAECAKADETTTIDVTATPNEDNSVTLTWPAVNGADTYTIEIKKNGVSVCTLVFNANGQLISINFAAPARDGKRRNVPAAEQSANGWTYIVTGLEGNASYTYSVTAKDINGNVLLKQSVDFSMGEELTSIEDVQGNNVQCTKVVRNGQLYLLRDGKVYNATGAEVK